MSIVQEFSDSACSVVVRSRSTTGCVQGLGLDAFTRLLAK